MKTLTIILLLVTFQLHSQITFEASIYQDCKLAVMADDYGNYPFTLDMIVKVKMYHKIFHTSFNYERADLQQPYNRLSVGSGVHYRHKFVELSQELNFGLIHRPFSVTPSFGIDTELAVIIKRVKIIGLLQVTQRSDHGSLIRCSSFLGFGYIIN